VAKKEASKSQRGRQAARGGPESVVSTGEAGSKKAPVRRQKAATKPAEGAVTGSPLPSLATSDASVSRNVADSRLDTLLEELRGVKRLVEQLATPPNDSDGGLDASVDSLRRLLSELMEQRMEAVIRDLVEVRREAASLPGDESQRIVARLEGLLEHLGAVRYEAEPLDVFDPLIHVAVDERQQSDAPEGVIVETLRPGYRTPRGLVVSKAAVIVNQRL
jgi:molecular chaperone GrpE (heat shock protein)